MVALVNELRRGAGIGELEVDRALTLVARERSNQLVSSFAHDLAYVVAVMPSGWSKLGENIAFSDLGMRDAQANLEASASHYANMVLPEYTRMGIGIVVTEGEHYDRVWVTQLFAAD